VKRTTGPRLAIWLLTRRLSAEWRDFVVGDLEEEFSIRRGHAPFAAHAWFWWQTIRCLAAPPPVRPHPLPMRSSPGDSRMRTFLADLHYAFRIMSRTPSFAVAIVSVLALGIGANTTIFSIVNAVLLRPLPFDEPERLVRIFTRTPGGRLFELSPGKFYDWQRDAQSFEGMAMYQCCGFRELALTGTGTARTVRATAVSAGFFEIVRARPALGRVFRPDEDTPGGKYVVVLSDRFWRSEFGAHPDVIGRTVKLNDEAYTIVGVMPASASVASWTGMASDVWIPLALTDEQRAVRGGHNRDGVARLKRDVELAQAQAEMDTISARLAREFPRTDGRGWGAVVIPMQEEIVGNSRTMLLMLLGAVGLVLLIACANVGNLLFTRGLSRRKEIAIRSALGAGRGRVFQQLLTEALLLAGAGGALGLLLAYGTLTSASTLFASQVPRAEEISIDGPVLLFAVGVSMLTGLLAGTLPAVRGGRSDLGSLNGALKEGGRSDGAIGVRTRRLLIVCEVALSLVLLMGAGVMIQSLLALRYGDTGFDPNNVLTMRVRLVDARYPSPAQRWSFFDAALQRIRALPGVEATGTIDDLPFADGESQTLALEGYPAQREPVAVQVRQITPGYLRAMGIPVLRGRDAVDSDAEVLLVSQETAKLYWGEGDPIGRRAALPFSKTVLRQVVGVVGDVKQRSLTEGPTPTAYYYTREPSGRATFVVRTSVPPAALAQPVVAAIRAIDPEQPVVDTRTMVQVLDEKLAPQRFSALLLGLFAGVALLLAAVGIYSVLSYIVRGRSREIGVRAALGAQRADILRLVVVEGMWPVLAGIVAGTLASVASAKVMRTLVFGVSASDPLTLAAVAATLTVVALMASLIPAYRALRLDPVNVLRAE
jgi:putative ABC transport system permease protein